MIEKMKKYTFVLYHLEYPDFLTKLQELGMVHIIRSTDLKTDTLLQNQELLNDYSEALKFLSKIEPAAEKSTTNLPTKALLNQLNNARDEKEALLRKQETLRKQIRDLQPWGHFEYELVTRLQENGVGVQFYHCLKNHFKQEWETEHTIRVIAERSGIIYFVLMYQGEAPALEADRFSFHNKTLHQLDVELDEHENRISAIDEYISGIAPVAQDIFQKEIRRITGEYAYEDASLQGTSEVEDHLRVISGWIPISKEENLKRFVKEQQLIHFSEEGRVEDNPPISLKNNWFNRLFEPITRMYMLPKYNEFDLTPFFAPFFMLFFGFCNADIAYGVIIVLLTLILRAKIKDPTTKGFMTLVTLFGVSSIIMGWVMGTILGFDMKEIPAIGERIIIRNTDQIFNFGLLLGVIQILFGIIISTVKKIKQAGFINGVSTIGTFLFIATLAILGAAQLGTDISAVAPYLKYPMWSGLALILLFNKPGKNPLINIGSGLWLLYNLVTGFFGDILSYIRLFALGVSSAILGFVINSIGAQIAGAPIIGPVLFVIFMILGHTLNLALGGLSGFVHPLRLTFVEFFKNAEFVGPGMEYKPFSKSIR
jgi:V/A-type H+-transporting ATPase subunit I